MTTRRARLRVPVAILFSVTIASVGCAGSGSQPAPTAVAPLSSGPATDSTPDACAAVPGSAPIWLVVFQDKTGSANHTRTEQFSEEDLVRLLSLVCRGGGWLTFGLISDNSNDRLLRLTVEPPPPAPVPDALPPNPLAAADVGTRNHKAQYAYQSALKGWHDTADGNIGLFFEDAMALLQRPSDYPRTDVVQALMRGSLALNEPTTGPEPHRWWVLASDGEDTVHRKGLPNVVPGRLLLVNGAGRTGILPAFNPLRFEAVSAAIDYLEHVEARALRPASQQ